LIDVAVSGGGNVVKKQAEKILKYKDLTIEIQRVCNVKNESGTRTWDNWNHLKIIQENVRGKHNIK